MFSFLRSALVTAFQSPPVNPVIPTSPLPVLKGVPECLEGREGAASAP